MYNNNPIYGKPWNLFERAEEYIPYYTTKGSDDFFSREVARAREEFLERDKKPAQSEKPKQDYKDKKIKNLEILVEDLKSKTAAQRGVLDSNEKLSREQEATIAELKRQLAEKDMVITTLINENNECNKDARLFKDQAIHWRKECLIRDGLLKPTKPKRTPTGMIG